MIPSFCFVVLFCFVFVVFFVFVFCFFDNVLAAVGLGLLQESVVLLNIQQNPLLFSLYFYMKTNP